MLLREQYQEHSERDYLSVPLATYHFEQVTIPLHWHREVELILPQEAGELELEGQLHPYGPQELLCVNQGVLHRTWAPIPLADLLVVDLDSLLSPLLRQEGGSFLTRLAEGSLVFPLGVGRDTPAYRELAASFRACVGLVREKPPGWELPVQLELLKLLETYHSHGLLVERGGGTWSRAEVDACKENILQLLDFLEIRPYGSRKGTSREVEDAHYETVQANGYWYPEKQPGDTFAQGELLGRVESGEGETLQAITAPFDGVVLYQTHILGVSQGMPLLAYGKLRAEGGLSRQETERML